MRKIILILGLLVLSAVGMNAHYSIHTTSRGVKVENATSTKDATKGMMVKATDYVIIPTGGVVEIYNELDKRIYRSTDTGKISITRLMMDARKSASDNRQTVTSRLRFGKGGAKTDNGNRVYVEKGMVRRSLAVYDPEAENIQMDSRTLGRYLAARILSENGVTSSAMPVSVTHGAVDGEGLYFRVVNNIDFPVYFNICKYVGIWWTNLMENDWYRCGRTLGQWQVQESAIDYRKSVIV